MTAAKKIRVGPAVCIKVMSPPPKNVIVCLPVIGTSELGQQLQSDPLSQESADVLAAAINEQLGVSHRKLRT